MQIRNGQKVAFLPSITFLTQPMHMKIKQKLLAEEELIWSNILDHKTLDYTNLIFQERCVTLFLE